MVNISTVVESRLNKNPDVRELWGGLDQPWREVDPELDKKDRYYMKGCKVFMATLEPLNNQQTDEGDKYKLIIFSTDNELLSMSFDASSIENAQVRASLELVRFLSQGISALLTYK